MPVTVNAPTDDLVFSSLQGPTVSKTGTYYWGAIVDRLNWVQELDENNNAITGNVIIIQLPRNILKRTSPPLVFLSTSLRRVAPKRNSCINVILLVFFKPPRAVKHHSNISWQARSYGFAIESIAMKQLHKVRLVLSYMVKNLQTGGSYIIAKI